VTTAKWRQYQEDAAAFFRTLGLDAEVGRVIQGVRSQHEIDVYVSFEKWGIRQTWIVDCKDHKRQIEKAYVETLKSIVSEVGASLGFLISEVGFQPGAIEAARNTNVVLTSLVELSAKSRTDLLAQALAAVDLRCLSLKDVLSNELQCEFHDADGYSGLCVLDGIDEQEWWQMLGIPVMLEMAIDRVRLGDMPVVVPGDLTPGSDDCVVCRTFEGFLAEASRLLDLGETWAASQSRQGQ
jgi:hypothetical protein